MIRCTRPLSETIFVYQCHFFKIWQSTADHTWRTPAKIILSPLQMETVTKILIKMCPLSTDGAILILVLHAISSGCTINACILRKNHAVWERGSVLFVGSPTIDAKELSITIIITMKYYLPASRWKWRFWSYHNFQMEPISNMTKYRRLHCCYLLAGVFM